MFDKQVNAFMAPLVVETDAEAIRIFTTWVNSGDKNQTVSMYPEHFALWKLGSYDTSNGNLETDQKELITGNACKNDEPKYTIKELMELIQENK